MNRAKGAGLGAKDAEFLWNELPIVYKRKRSRVSQRTCVKGDTRLEKSQSVEHVNSISNTEIGNYVQGSTALTLTRGVTDTCPFAFPHKIGWGKFRIGTSGYVYQHWKNIVYPAGEPQKQWFHLYTRVFDTVEINNTFYRLPGCEVFESWRSQAPQGFCYSLKFSRYGTHMKRLKDPEGPISLFIERARHLGQHFLGPILVQLPPKFNVYIERLKEFLQSAPSQFRWAIEVRDPRWLCEDVYSLLHAYNTSLCIHDHEDIHFPHPKVLTANWIYLRFHGHNYQQCYKIEQLQEQALLVKKYLQSGIDVYAYFNNDHCGYAAFNALDLKKLVLQSLQV